MVTTRVYAWLPAALVADIGADHLRHALVSASNLDVGEAQAHLVECPTSGYSVVGQLSST